MKKVLIVSFIIIVIQFFPGQVFADLYKWVDENGATHYSDTPSSSAPDVETVENRDLPPPAKSLEPSFQSDNTSSPNVTPDRKPQNKVEIYTTSWCGYCKKAIAFLKANDIKYKQYDIEKDRKAASRMKKLGGTGGVPFAIINGEKVIGFSPQLYKQVLGLP